MKYLLFLFILPFLMCSPQKQELTDDCLIVASAIENYFEIESEYITENLEKDSSFIPYITRSFIIVPDKAVCYTENMMICIGFELTNKRDVYTNGNKSIIESYTNCEKMCIIYIIYKENQLSVIFKTIEENEWNLGKERFPESNVFNVCT